MRRFANVTAVLAALVLALALTGCGIKTGYDFSSSEGSTITCHKDGTCDFSLVLDDSTYAGSGTYEDNSYKALGDNGYGTSISITIEGTTEDDEEVSITLRGHEKDPGYSIGGQIRIGVVKTTDFQSFKLNK